MFPYMESYLLLHKRSQKGGIDTKIPSFNSFYFMSRQSVTLVLVQTCKEKEGERKER